VRVISTNTNAAVANEPYPATPIGLPTLCQMAFDGLDLAPVWNRLVLRVKAQPDDAAALLDLSTIAQLQGRPQDRVALQAAALKLQQVYRRPSLRHARSGCSPSWRPAISWPIRRWSSCWKARTSYST
jgi:hypothetical protein